MNPDAATVLERLIIACEAVLGLRNAGADDYLVQLAEDVSRFAAMPTDSTRVIHPYTCQAMVALRHAATAQRHGYAHREHIYFRIVGVILPDIRKDFSTAIELRKRPTP